MRNLQRYIKRCECHRMKRKTKRLMIKKNQNHCSVRVRPEDGNPGVGWMAALISQLIRREKGHVDKDKERRHQAR
jgi:hypothetical protein